uniref:Transmembrane protein 243 isoform X2 n=1 Tax=Geotrypetes seraphini TaxID=260995 RepID=A0A6P8S823_GEOSA|nr:transmembrane protein 243 isoform X2 [Geotrypetes seraphini]
MPPDYYKLTVLELQELCSSRGIEVKSQEKEALVMLLIAKDQENQATKNDKDSSELCSQTNSTSVSEQCVVYEPDESDRRVNSLPQALDVTVLLELERMHLEQRHMELEMEREEKQRQEREREREHERRMAFLYQDWDRVINLAVGLLTSLLVIVTLISAFVFPHLPPKPVNVFFAVCIFLTSVTALILLRHLVKSRRTH